jgi:hypothetical protein
MTFFYDLNKKLDTIREKPETTHKQLNERDEGKPGKNFAKIAKDAGERYGSKAAGERVAGAVRNKLKAQGKLEEEGMGDMARKVGSMAKKVGGAVLNKLGHGDDEAMRKDLQRKMGVPKQQQHGKPSMAKSNEDYGPMEGEGGKPMTPKQKSFAKLAPPADKITFADKIAGAKKEVDERLGDVAAEAIKGALSPKQKKIDMNKNGKLDANDFAMLRKGGKKQVADEGWDDMMKDVERRHNQPKVGSVTRGHKHDIETTATGRKVTRRVDDQGHSVGADDASDTPPAKRGRGRPAGTGSKMGAKGPSGKSKLMTKENDFDPADQGEYDQEGEMAKDSIKTVVRHAQALEKILGDNDNLPEWVQSKLAKIESMMSAVDDYMQNQEGGDEEMAVGEESTNKRDNRAEKAGKKVTKDIEYDEKKDKKKKEVDETTSSGSVATSGSAPKSGGGHNYGKGIYDSLNRQLENMISESMNINMSMNNDENGGPKKSLTVTATDEDAVMLSSLLKMAGLGQDDDQIHAMTGDDSDMDALHNIDHMHGEEPCADCGSSPCACDDLEENLIPVPAGGMEEDRWGAEQPPKLPYDVTADGGLDVKKASNGWEYKSKDPGGRVTVTIPAKTADRMFPNTNVDEAYGDTDASENEPDWPTDEEGTDDAMMYSGGLNGPKSTGQTTVPVIAHQNDRMGYEGDSELRRMMEIAGLR